MHDISVSYIRRLLEIKVSKENCKFLLFRSELTAIETALSFIGHIDDWAFSETWILNDNRHFIKLSTFAQEWLLMAYFVNFNPAWHPSAATFFQHWLGGQWRGR
ncbi:hypothetical protein AVEN_231634-1 [Araneus ventricosus]|uniref:Uncharacterized protein n=1 Tax=Araneus ventricosus TaxID=182803 RepID=A0A4Y2K415_ARAVE|nr:hypothetical protein AVEN_231634-1 [Araneus ventricosus]